MTTLIPVSKPISQLRLTPGSYERMIGRRKLQPDDPPPDLAIETDVTSLTTITAYRAIAVPEVWIYADGNLIIHTLQAGDYVQSEASPLFPGLPIVPWIKQAVSRSWTVGSLQALEELEACFQQFQENAPLQ
ncbi:Uma2 family endonuclease [Leptolyngbya sp. PCC 6406]|uniref:Uma2 family endonuclease n=1 Tax=Leptolyngbya sp. PCC 6406 TaxID=1173264 RepID=UPI0002AC8046|nr:Uma2 family endonuclease [Leptolyngbya sp. PCC 6406]